ncbi:MAG: hypothetical protein QOH93_2243 [Chloroflexia bacterium]|jgi:hypothetical protein|nr:hypothetical protein [Chloroflexia bacterium]
MDIRDRVMGDQPNDFLHKIASIIPGYKGYVDRERRRDADRLLRTELAHRYQAELTRLKRVQQGLLKGGDLNSIGEIDGVSGKLQRFIDRLQNATYGYAGLFAPVKVEGEELDQIYAFDMALASGVDTLSGAIGAVESAAEGQAKGEARSAIDHLSSVVNDLNDRFDQRSDLLTSGTTIPQDQYQAMVSGFQQPAGSQSGAAGGQYAPYGQAGQQGQGQAQPETPSPYAQQGQSPSTTATGSAGTYGGQGYSGGAPTTAMGSAGGVATTGQAGIAGSGASLDDVESPTSTGPIATAAAGQDYNMLPVDDPSISGSSGTPTTRVPWGGALPHDPAVDSMAQGNQGFAGTPTSNDQGGSRPMTEGGEAGTGIESASSPAAAPGAPGGDIVDSMDLANNMNAMSDPGSVSGTDLSVDPTGPSSNLGGSTTDLNLNSGTTGQNS